MERNQTDSTLLKLENRKRLAAGKKELKDLAEIEEPSAEDNTNEIDREDPLLRESAQILIDYINLSVPAMASK